MGDPAVARGSRTISQATAHAGGAVGTSRGWDARWRRSRVEAVRRCVKAQEETDRRVSGQVSRAGVDGRSAGDDSGGEVGFLPELRGRRSLEAWRATKRRCSAVARRLFRRRVG